MDKKAFDDGLLKIFQEFKISDDAIEILLQKGLATSY